VDRWDIVGYVVTAVVVVALFIVMALVLRWN
jgi:hypothetical protein